MEDTVAQRLGVAPCTADSEIRCLHGFDVQDLPISTDQDQHWRSRDINGPATKSQLSAHNLERCSSKFASGTARDSLVLESVVSNSRTSSSTGGCCIRREGNSARRLTCETQI